MKSKRIIQRDKTAALYARLMVEEYMRRNEIGYADGIFYVGFGNASGYLYFLRSQATYTPSSQGYYYALAVREITGNGQRAIG